MYISLIRAERRSLNLISLFRLMRVSNWIKNIVIFFPVLFDGQLTNVFSCFKCLMGFVVFCLLSSTVYVINDIADQESDKLHPTKCKRPIASGEVSIVTAYILIFFLLINSFVLAYLYLTINAWIMLLLYLLFNILYSFKLKKIGLVDVSMIALFFELRLFLGGQVANIQISHWLSLLTFFLAIFIAFSKRHDDVLLSNEIHKEIRDSLKSYNLDFLNAIILLLASVLLITYLLYTISDTGGMKYNHNFYITSFFVFLGICRYLQLILVFKKGGNPVKIFYSDKTLLFYCFSWMCLLVFFIYFK